MTDTVNLLLVEDDEVDVQGLKRAFTKNRIGNPITVARDGIEAAEAASHELVEAHDGATRLRCAEEQSFDCVLLDYRLPDIDAFAVLKALLSGRNGNDTVLMLTGESDREVAFRLMRGRERSIISQKPR